MLGLGGSLSTGGYTDSEFTPASVSGIAHWFKYNTNLTLGTGDELSTWGDNYGSETLTVAAGKVLKNSGDLNFDTNNGRMTLDATWDPGSFSVYIVARIMVSTVSNEEIMAVDNSNFFRLNNATQARVKIGSTASNDITLPGDSIVQNTWFVFGIEWDGTTISIYQDTSPTTPATAEDTDVFAGLNSLGLRGNPFDGQIRELVLVNNELSASDRANLFTHLNAVRDL
jgi:hypothetical protein